MGGIEAAVGKCPFCHTAKAANCIIAYGPRNEVICYGKFHIVWIRGGKSGS